MVEHTDIATKKLEEESLEMPPSFDLKTFVSAQQCQELPVKVKPVLTTLLVIKFNTKENNCKIISLSKLCMIMNASPDFFSVIIVNV